MNMNIADFRIDNIEYPTNPLSWAEGNADAVSITATDQKIRSFKALPGGWHYGEGIAPSPAMIESARDWLKQVTQYGFLVTDAFPGIAGEIMISGRRGEDEIELILENDNTISFYHQRNDESVSEPIERGDPNDIEDALGKAADQWSILDLSMLDILRPIKIDSLGWRFEIMEVAHRSYFANALIFQTVNPYAHTSGITIQMPPESRRYFGSWIGHQGAVEPQFQLLRR